MTASTVGGTCAARPDDLPEIVALFGRVYPGTGVPPARLTAHLQRILFEHPWQQLTVSSLAYRDREARLVGFLGALPRPMTASGRPIIMAVGHHFMVDPEHRGTLAALQLLRAFVSGPQDLSICESAADVRKLWHAVGGTTSHLYSPTWTRPLRPATYLASLLHGRGRLGAVASLASPLCRILDHVALAARSSPYYLAPDQWALDDVGADALVEHIHRFSERCHLRPRYDAASLTWLLELLRAKQTIGSLELRLVRGSKGRALGYFLYVAVPGGVSQVVQIGASDETMSAVFRALAADASRRGAIALSGRLDPRYLSEMTGPSSVKHTGNWLLIHTRDAAIERAIHMGEAFLTRLESEWWLPFQE